MQCWGLVCWAFPSASRPVDCCWPAVLVLLSYGVCQLSMHLLLYSAQLTNKRSYEELARTVFGRTGSKAVNVCIVSLNITCMVAYISILADVLSSVAGSVIPPGAEPSRNVLMTGITVFGVLPVAMLVKSPEVLALVSQASVGFVFFFATVMAVLAFSPIAHADRFVLWDWQGLLLAFPVVTYGFTAHHFLFGIYATLRQHTVKRMSSVLRKAMLVCALVYIAVGACGYSSFRQMTAGDVLRNLGAEGVEGLRGAYERLLKLGYGLSILGSVPLALLPIYDSMLWTVAFLAPPPPTFSPLKDQPPPAIAPSPVQERFLTILVVGLALALAIMVPNVELIFGLAGSAPAALLAFVFPAALFLAASASSRTVALFDTDELRTPSQGGHESIPALRRKALALLLFGTVVGVACTHATIMAVHQEAEVIQLAQEIVARNQQVEQAVQYENKAIKVAAAIAGVAKATHSVSEAQEHSIASLGAVQQAAAALRSLNVESPAAAPGHPVHAAATQHAHKDQQAQLESFALGAVNANLKDLKQRVNTTLVALSSVTEALGDSAAKLQKAEAEAAAADQQVRVKKAKQELARIGTSDTKAKGDASGQGKAAKQDVWASAGGEEASDVETKGEGEEKPGGGTAGQKALEKVLAQANDTLAAVKHTADVLDDAERATEAVERAKGSENAEGKLEAAKVMEKAVNVTNEAAKKVESTLTALKEAQEEAASELVDIVKQLASDTSQTDLKERMDMHAQEQRENFEKPVYDKESGERISKDSSATAKEAKEAFKALKELSDAGKKDPNPVKAVEMASEVAKKAVRLASSVVDSALRGVNMTVERFQKNPEVAARAGQIAKELNKRKKEAKEGETGARNGTEVGPFSSLGWQVSEGVLGDDTAAPPGASKFPSASAAFPKTSGSQANRTSEAEDQRRVGEVRSSGGLSDSKPVAEKVPDKREG
eukprot:jgi/Botrbrau1/19384/Bobra.0338s0014.1